MNLRDDPFLLIQLSPHLAGCRLETPGGSRAKPFHIKAVSDDGVSIGTFSGGRVLLRPSVFQVAVKYLADRGHVQDAWLKVSDTFFQELTKIENGGTPCTSYVLPILEAAHLIDLDRGHPNRVRLRQEAPE